jgi:hypothetical protein
LLERVDTERLRMPFPLQKTKGDETAGHMLPLGPLRAGLTAREGQLILADTDDGLQSHAAARWAIIEPCGGVTP